jgi:hypothetical protein
MTYTRSTSKAPIGLIQSPGIELIGKGVVIYSPWRIGRQVFLSLIPLDKKAWLLGFFPGFGRSLFVAAMDLFPMAISALKMFPELRGGIEGVGEFFSGRLGDVLFSLDNGLNPNLAPLTSQFFSELARGHPKRL